MVEPQASVDATRPIANHTFPLVDRQTFLQEFKTIFSGRAPTHSGWLSIEGGWGMGRSALLDAACLTAHDSGCIVLRTRGDDAVASAPFRVLRQLLEDVATLRNANEEMTERIQNVLDCLEREGERNVDALGAVFHRLVVSVRRLGFVVLAVDDAHHVDEATMRCFENLFHRLDDQQIWLLTTSPPRTAGTAPLVIDQLLVHQNIRHFALSPLSRGGALEVLSTQLNVEPEHTFVDAVLEATSGRPGFVVELARSCSDEHVAPDNDAASQLDRLFIPRIAESVLTRLNRLGPAARELLESCAVFGELGDVARLLRLADIDPDTSERAIDSLKHAEFLRQSPTLEFVAPVVRWAVLRVIPSPRRSRLHARSADLLELAGADESMVVSHLLATEPAWSEEVTARLRVAGDRLLVQGDVRVAAQCLRHSMKDVATVDQVL
jgi:hypothetical protein